MSDPLDSARALHRAGRLAEAEALYCQILGGAPGDYIPRCLFGLLRMQQGRAAEAAELFAAALALKPDSVEALSNGALAFKQLGRLDEALVWEERALALMPGEPQLLANHADTLQALGRHDQALAVYRQALALKPDFVPALGNRANLLRILGRDAEALADYQRVLLLRPRHPHAMRAHAQTLLALGRPQEALAGFERAMAASVLLPEDWLGRGIALTRLGRMGEAAASFDRALALRPDWPEAWSDRGAALEELGRLDEAVASYNRALALRPGDLTALNNRSVALQRLRRFAEAAKGYEIILAAQPEHPYALGGLANCALHTCDWARGADLMETVRRHILDDISEIPPGTLMGYSGDPALALACARNYARRRFPAAASPLWLGTPFSGERIRLAYCSADFHDHATAHLMAELFERHDRARFEVTAISFGDDDSSPMRARLKATFDRFEDMRGRSDGEIAQRIAGLGTDIAVDLKGYTLQARSGIFALRPAPVQVNYLGFPGTMGADFIDYVIADAIVLPRTQQPFYAETILHLPDCYQPNDTSRRIAPRIPARAEAGLPEQGLVFCCFNNNWKIAEPVFAIWMRLLAVVPQSVLWLLQDSEEAADNLRRHAVSRGIAPERLIFAPRADMADHLARHKLADLFLDTLPYNAHTTASDCLWVGVPLVTCRGEGFPGRVAASLLHAMNLCELVTETLADYEALALALAQDKKRLAALKEKLAAARADAPLFDMTRFARHIEAAFEEMVSAWRRAHSAG